MDSKSKHTIQIVEVLHEGSSAGAALQLGLGGAPPGAGAQAPRPRLPRGRDLPSGHGRAPGASLAPTERQILATSRKKLANVANSRLYRKRFQN